MANGFTLDSIVNGLGTEVIVRECDFNVLGVFFYLLPSLLDSGRI